MNVGLTAGAVAVPQLRDEVEESLERLSALLLRATDGTAGTAEGARNGVPPGRTQ